MNERIIKTFTASMPKNKYSDNILRLYVYASAYHKLYKMQNDYELVNVEEKFYDNEKAEFRKLDVILTFKRKEKLDHEKICISQF